MKVGMGSKNKTKLAAFQAALADYPLFDGAEIIGVDAVTDIFGHPKSLKETIEGAIARAKKAYDGHDYGFGIEGGLMEVPYTKTGYMEVAACAIYDGTNVCLGLSPAQEWPRLAFDAILNQGMDGSQAMAAAGLASGGKLGEGEGFNGKITKGRMDRTACNKAAIIMALSHLEFPDYY